MKKTLGIITADPNNDPSIAVFKSLQEKFDCRIQTINPFQPFDLKDFDNVDILYHRISGRGQEIVDQKINFYIKAINETGLPYIGNIENLNFAKNKYNQVVEARKAGLKTPQTVLILDNAAPESFIGDLSFPLVLKCAYSFGGKDVHLVRNLDELKSALNNEEQYLIQEFIKLDQVVDYRVYVVGKEVVGGIIRQNKTEGEFRANTTQGATAKFFSPGGEISELALRYVEHLGAEILAVDFIKKDNEYYFIESNDSFSVRIDNEPKKIIVAESIIKYCLDRIGKHGE